MTTIAIGSGPSACRYVLRQGLLADAPALLASMLGGGRCFVVSDSNVAPLWADAVAARLRAPLLVLPAGEEHKRLAAVERVVRWLVGHGAERRDLVVAVGGGVVTDLAGFAAAIALRGLAWVAVPTTLLGMVDAAVGGKTGADLEEGKNLVGAFWTPRMVLADPATLGTLDPRQLRSGLAEVVKTAMIVPSAVVPQLDRRLRRVCAGEVHQADTLVAAAVRVKAEIVAADEREEGGRAALNLGHTLGHALEAATGYTRFLHGEAVAWGLLAALLLARRRGMLATDAADTWATRLEPLAPLPPLDDLRWSELSGFLGRDKKRSGGALRWVLPEREGVVLGVEVPDREAAGVFDALRRLPACGPFTPLP